MDSKTQVVGIYKTKFQAQTAAGERNVAEWNALGPDDIPRCLFYVLPILEEQLREVVASRFRQHLSEDREAFLRGYNGFLKPLAGEMVVSMLYSIKTCEWTQNNRLTYNGGWLVGYKRHFDGFGDVKCSAIYSGCEEVSLEVAVVRGKEEHASIVGVFSSEEALLSWLLDGINATEACENKLIDMICDRYRHLLY